MAAVQVTFPSGTQRAYPVEAIIYVQFSSGIIKIVDKAGNSEDFTGKTQADYDGLISQMNSGGEVKITTC